MHNYYDVTVSIDGIEATMPKVRANGSVEDVLRAILSDIPRLYADYPDDLTITMHKVEP